MGIQPLLKRQPLKHNVVDRDKVLIPPNWDSWGKIRALDKSFDVERVNKGWIVDLQENTSASEQTDQQSNRDLQSARPDHPQLASATSVYEELIPDSRRHILAMGEDDGDEASKNGKLEVESVDTQTFLASQLEVLERLRLEEELTTTTNQRETRGGVGDPSIPKSSRDVIDGAINDELGRTFSDGGLVREHIGPVQFNVGGIQVDADDMLKRIVVSQPFFHPCIYSPHIYSPHITKLYSIFTLNDLDSSPSLP